MAGLSNSRREQKDGIYADERDSVIGLALSRVNKPKIKPPSDYESEGDNDGTKL